MSFETSSVSTTSTDTAIPSPYIKEDYDFKPRAKYTPHVGYHALKRSIDISTALIFIILSFPIWAVICFLIKYQSKGPAIIRQERAGKKGTSFMMYKFRTMHAHVPLYEKSPGGKEDPRITPIGRLLRQSSLDELPQLINVLLGSMSLVGPRPEMFFIVQTYTHEQRKRLEVAPGLTGLWQISGRKDKPLTENLYFDFYYIDNQSIVLDIKIILKTIPAVLFRRGAY